jgi:penicillin-binding protein 2
MAIDRRATRLGALALTAMLLVGALGARLWFLQGTQQDVYEARVVAAKTRTVLVAPERGRILDADGRVLADNRRVLTVAVDWSMMRRTSNRDALLERLSGPLKTPVIELQQRYNPCYPNQKIDDCDIGNIYDSLLPLPLKEDVDEQTIAFIMERAEDYPGVTVVEQWERVYPYAPLASHVIGYLGSITKETKDDYLSQGYKLNERVGQFGVELSMEEFLHGRWGTRVFQIDAAGAVVRELADRNVMPVAGNDIQLSIDLDLQQYAEQALQTQLLRRRELPPTSEPGSGVEAQQQNILVENPDTLEDEPNDPTRPLGPVPYKAPAGSVVVMNQETGQVAAMASYPTFDNRWLNAGISKEKYDQIFPTVELPNGKADPDFSVFTNRAIQGQYNLGSTIKPFIAWSAMHSGLTNANEVWEDTTGTYTLQSIDSDTCQVVKCVFRNALDGSGVPSRYGPVRVEESLAVSSDTFYYRLGERFYTTPGKRDDLKADLEQFGFGSESGILLPYEWDGRIPDDAIKKDLLENGVLAEGEVPFLTPGDYIQVSIGQGLMAATPLQITNAYATLGNGGELLRPQVVQAVLAPLTPDDRDRPGYADLAAAQVVTDFSQPEVRLRLDMPSEVLDPIVRGLTRVVSRNGGVVYPAGRYRWPTGEKLFSDYASDRLPIAGKTGTAQGFGSYPWNDSSAFAAFSRDASQPYTVGAYLEKSGYGSRAAAPLVKCMFSVLNGTIAPDPVQVSEPLDLASTTAASPQVLQNQTCLGGADLTQRD